MPANRRGDPFAPFRLDYFPSVWGSNATYFFATQVYLVTLQWLATELTDSRAILGLVIAIQGGVVAICSPIGGVIADRFQKRGVVAGTRLGLALMIVGLNLLLLFDWIVLWHLLVASAIGGLFNALGQPGSQTYVLDVVGSKNAQPAIALNSAAIGLGQMIGPALAGLLIAGGGIVGSWSCAVVGLLLAGWLLWRIPIRGEASTPQRSPLLELREGFSYILRTPPVALALVGCAMAFFNGAIFAMRPIFARDLLEVGSQGMGMMAATAGLGTLLGSLGATMLPDIRRPGWVITLSMLAFSCCVLLYSLATSLAYVLVIEFMSGLAAQIWQISSFSGLQTSVPERLRGRVMGVLFTVVQLAQVGGLFVGLTADRFGDRTAMATFGLIPIVVLVSIMLFGGRTLGRLGEGTIRETR